MWKARSTTAQTALDEKSKQLEQLRGEINTMDKPAFVHSLEKAQCTTGWLQQLKVCIEGSVTRLGLEATAAMIVTLNRVADDVQDIRNTFTQIVNGREREVAKLEEVLKATNDLCSCLRSRSEVGEAEYKKLTTVTEKQETLLSKARTYLKVVIAERLAWQEMYGANAAKLPTHMAAGFVERCSSTMAMLDDAHSANKLPSVGALEATSGVVNRFQHRVDNSLNHGSVLLRYIPPEEEIKLLNEALKGSGSDVALHKELADRERKFASSKEEMMERCQSAVLSLQTMRATMAKIREQLVLFSRDESVLQLGARVTNAISYFLLNNNYTSSQIPSYLQGSSTPPLLPLGASAPISDTANSASVLVNMSASPPSASTKRRDTTVAQRKSIASPRADSRASRLFSSSLSMITAAAHLTRSIKKDSSVVVNPPGESSPRPSATMARKSVAEGAATPKQPNDLEQSASLFAAASRSGAEGWTTPGSLSDSESKSPVESPKSRDGRHSVLMVNSFDPKQKRSQKDDDNRNAPNHERPSGDASYRASASFSSFLANSLNGAPSQERGKYGRSSRGSRVTFGGQGGGSPSTLALSDNAPDNPLHVETRETSQGEHSNDEWSPSNLAGGHRTPTSSSPATKDRTVSITFPNAVSLTASVGPDGGRKSLDAQKPRLPAVDSGSRLRASVRAVTVATLRRSVTSKTATKPSWYEGGEGDEKSDDDAPEEQQPPSTFPVPNNIELVFQEMESPHMTADVSKYGINRQRRKQSELNKKVADALKRTEFLEKQADALVAEVRMQKQELVVRGTQDAMERKHYEFSQRVPAERVVSAGIGTARNREAAQQQHGHHMIPTATSSPRGTPAFSGDLKLLRGASLSQSAKELFDTVQQVSPRHTAPHQ